MMRKFLIALTRNPISLAGTAIATAAVILIFTLVAIEIVGFLANPYVGILTYMILPAVFVVGLLLIPWGIARERRKARQAEAEGRRAPSFPVIDLNTPRTRTFVLIFLVMTAVNTVILATATYKGVEVMESTEFCGTTCHTVMEPEHTAHSRSPHSRVGCVDCHIGPGAGWFVKSKLSGAWQVVSVAFDLYPRPIASPVHNLRPARETCEQCHWPTKFVGDLLKVINHHEDDEANTELKTVLLLKVGGMRAGDSAGIHWHVDPANQIRYRSDESRETIYEVEMTQADGTVKRYVGPDAEATAGAEGPAKGDAWRTMDCVDCHNRPTHIYGLPESEVDEAIDGARIASDLPYIRREGVAAIQQDFATTEEARQGIAETIQAFYASEYSDLASTRADEIQQAAQELGNIYAVNVFPKMNVQWGTYPNHIGHEGSPGCFRCHSDEHATEAGEVISQDCDTCHALLAWGEEDPEIMATLYPE